MSLDLHRLEKTKQRGEKIIARCPACAEDNRDRTGEHLVIFADGRFACSANPGDPEHRRRIFALVGVGDALPESREQTHRPAPTAQTQAPAVKPQEPDLPHDFARIGSTARSLLARSPEAQELASQELGITRATVEACTMPSGGALGFFPSIAIKGRPCHPNRIGYIYPGGIKLRKPWGDLGARFAWACGKATEPWRYTVAAWRSWITHFIITEGESDTLALIQSGMGRLCNNDTAVVASPGTAFLPAWAPLFTGRHVTLCFDCDGPGQQAARKVAKEVHPFALSVIIQTGWRRPGHE